MTPEIALAPAVPGFTVVLLMAVSAANSLLLPAHQVNAMLKLRGGFRNADCLKAGGGLTLFFLVVVVSMFYLFYL